MQVIVAILGLIVAPGVSDVSLYVSEQGKVSVTDFSEVQFKPNSPVAAFVSSGSTQEMISNAYGRVGEATIQWIEDPTQAELEKCPEDLFFQKRPTEDLGTWQSLIFLLDYATDESLETRSTRLATSTTICDPPKTSTFITESGLLIDEGDGTHNFWLWSGLRSRTIATWAAQEDSDCGPRCTNVRALVPISGFNATDPEHARIERRLYILIQQAAATSHFELAPRWYGTGCAKVLHAGVRRRPRGGGIHGRREGAKVTCVGSPFP
ncbi:uncharacterized protein A1O9_10735 [Exophiala aquamarina CBS 119918]|uniref:Uncharacterized protein n=1 Tax=Exophiala aquamarina CBS 119918 TaxID=1182545 RepID=A0A072P0U9_9EURO|nr:uncharacterized protein A1O9_10735 [Exophiala aquamarina CBS 119918]KEF53287.1 hypothetical protein A1O9_10735 [Exophiala aquamarina CBS 119918]